MPHTIEPAASGRSKCRGCGLAIAKDELRLGERLPNPFVDDEKGEMTLWFHLVCSAYKRPQAMLEALEASTENIERRDWLAGVCKQGIEHRRLPRAAGVERASTGRAACRGCREKIEKGSWRIKLLYFDEGRFAPSGYVHVGCAREYLGTTSILERIAHFTPELTAEDRAELEGAHPELGP